MIIGLAVLLGTVVLATVVGLALRARDGRIKTARATPTAGGWALAGVPPGDSDRVLLLQLSAPACAPCRRTAEVLDAYVTGRADVVYREVDVAERPDVASSLGVLRTPTVVAFDRTGTELLRFSGMPRLSDLAAALPGAERP